MAIHDNPASLTVEAIDEYLTIAGLCIDRKKNDGGIYGYPATLLLFCIVNAIGKSQRSGNEPFLVLNDAPFNCSLSKHQVKQLEERFRNLLTHNAMVMPGTFLNAEDGDDPFIFGRNGEPVGIRLKALYKLVLDAWSKLDKSALHSRDQGEIFNVIADPIDFSGASLVGSLPASGAHYNAEAANRYRTGMPKRSR